MRTPPLECGRGTWAATPAGMAARDLLRAQSKGREAAEFATMADMGWRMRRSWRADANAWAAREHEAKARFAEVAKPHLDHLDTTIATAEIRTAELHGEVGAFEHWQRQHPEAGRRLSRLEADITRLDRQLAPEVDQAVGLDLRLIDLGLRPPTPEPPGHGLGLGL